MRSNDIALSVTTPLISVRWGLGAKIVVDSVKIITAAIGSTPKKPVRTTRMALKLAMVALRQIRRQHPGTCTQCRELQRWL